MLKTKHVQFKEQNKNALSENDFDNTIPEVLPESENSSPGTDSFIPLLYCSANTGNLRIGSKTAIVYGSNCTGYLYSVEKNTNFKTIIIKQ